MGWLNEGNEEREVLVGDETLDIAHEMLLRITRRYKRDVRRKPTPEELVRTLEIAIGAMKDYLFDGMDEKEVSRLSIRFRKAPKKIPHAVGDYCAIPLPGGGYGYCRIKDSYGHWSILVDLLDVYSESLLTAEALLGAGVVREELVDDVAIENGVWKLVGNTPPPNWNPKRKAFDRAMEHQRQFLRLGYENASPLVPGQLEEDLRTRGRIP